MTKMTEGWQKTMARAFEKSRAQVRSRLEHPFHVVKKLLHCRKASYMGISKDECQLNMLFALSNLNMVRAQVRPK